MKYAAVRRPPVGRPKVLERGLSLERANQMLKAGHCDHIEPDGFRDSLDAYGDRFVLLAGKRPVQPDWPHQVPTEREVEAHVRAGKNVGIKAGNGLAVLDFDDRDAEAAMLKKFGPLTPTVETGSGKRHYYVAVPAGVELPAKLKWQGSVVGEIQRTGAQQVVAPPSIHPDTNREYIWLHDPRGGIQTLPPSWLKGLMVKEAATDLPEWIKLGDTRGHEADGSEWDGPSADVILERASRQPGARRRAGGWKFQCAGCRAEGHDKHMDNAVVRPDGRWGCAVDSEHKRDIGLQLGIVRELPLEVEAPDADLPMQHDNPEEDLRDPE